MRIIIKVLATTVFLMALFGIVMVASATEKGATTDVSQLLGSNAVRQAMWLVIALAAGLVASHIDYELYKRPRLMLAMAVITVVLLALVFVPGIGHKAGGSYRWINLYFFKVQPSEFAKLAMVVLTCAWVDHVGWRVQRVWEGIVWPGVAIGIIAALLLLEPDVGAAAVVLIVCGAILFAAGVKVGQLVPPGLLGVALLVLVILLIPNRRERFFRSIDAKFGTQLASVEEDQEKARKERERVRHQPEEAKLAFINGGLLGVGYMESMQKKYYLPEAHTDFIFAIVGEEFGYFASTLVVLGFLTILTCGILISLRVPDRFGRYLAFGMTFLLIFQAGFNLIVVTDISLVTKGIALPFLSYGGTSLLASMIAIGVILNVGRAALQCEAAQETNAFRDAVQV